MCTTCVLSSPKMSSAGSPSSATSTPHPYRCTYTDRVPPVDGATQGRPCLHISNAAPRFILIHSDSDCPLTRHLISSLSCMLRSNLYQLCGASSSRNLSMLSKGMFCVRGSTFDLRSECYLTSGFRVVRTKSRGLIESVSKRVGTFYVVHIWLTSCFPC